MIIGYLIIASVLSLAVAATSLVLGGSVLGAVVLYVVTGNLSLLILVALAAILRKEPQDGAMRMASLPEGAA